MATLTGQLNEAQIEAAHTFACLEKLCQTLAEQKQVRMSEGERRRESVRAWEGWEFVV